MKKSEKILCQGLVNSCREMNTAHKLLPLGAKFMLCYDMRRGFGEILCQGAMRNKNMLIKFLKGKNYPPPKSGKYGERFSVTLENSWKITAENFRRQPIISWRLKRVCEMAEFLVTF